MKFTIWVDYGAYKGWHPSDFKTLEEVKKAIKEGLCSFNKFRITKELEIKIEVLKQDTE